MQETELFQELVLGDSTHSYCRPTLLTLECPSVLRHGVIGDFASQSHTVHYLLSLKSKFQMVLSLDSLLGSPVAQPSRVN